MSDPAELLAAALEYAAEGQPVFPCRNDGDKAKSPLVEGGFLAATTDETKIRSWWSRRPHAAIGIPTGQRYDVLDVDVKNGVNGYARLGLLNKMGLLDGCLEIVETPSGGLHLYFPTDPEREQRNWTGAQAGIDFRGKGGYVIAPPSGIATPDYRGHYTVKKTYTPSRRQPLDAEEVRRVLLPTTNHGAASNADPDAFMFPTSLTALQHFVQNLQQGERNNGLFWAVCRAVESDLDPEELTESALLIGLTEAEIRQTIGSVVRRVNR